MGQQVETLRAVGTGIGVRVVTAFKSANLVGKKRVRIDSSVLSMLRERLFADMLHEAEQAIEFPSSAAAEAFILETPELRRASAFSWYSGSGNRWLVAINRGGPSFKFVRQDGDRFFAGDMQLESLTQR